MVYEIYNENFEDGSHWGDLKYVLLVCVFLLYVPFSLLRDGIEWIFEKILNSLQRGR